MTITPVTHRQAYNFIRSRGHTPNQEVWDRTVERYSRVLEVSPDEPFIDPRAFDRFTGAKFARWPSGKGGQVFWFFDDQESVDKFIRVMEAAKR